MYTMTYTNTIKKTGEVLTEKVRVMTQQVGRDLIAKWNQQAKTFPPANGITFSYTLVSFARETTEDQEKLGIFLDLNHYQKADQDYYDR